MFCKNCGTELNENAKFCNGCGAAIRGDGETAQPVEATPTASTAKKHTLRNVLIAVAVIVVAVLIFRNTGKSETPTGSSGGYNTTSYNSGTSLSEEEKWVVGTWYSYAIFTNGNATPVSRHSSTLYIYDNHMGSLYADGELASTFTWYYDKYTEGSHFYNFYFINGVNIIGLYGEDSFILTLTGDSLIVFER